MFYWNPITRVSRWTLKSSSHNLKNTTNSTPQQSRAPAQAKVESNVPKNQNQPAQTKETVDINSRDLPYDNINVDRDSQNAYYSVVDPNKLKQQFVENMKTNNKESKLERKKGDSWIKVWDEKTKRS